jgi:SAM-dependent methyltransferase
MTSFDAYEHNLTTRLAELRRGDRAYTIHSDAILETLVYEASDAPDIPTQRILDVGCGLGFISLQMAQVSETEVMGIDPSEKAIELAKKEHHTQTNLDFMTASAQEFPDRMRELGIQAFDRAILNMVLHSVDDSTCVEILKGISASLTDCGVFTCIVPGRGWLIQKLIENAQANGMEEKPGILWVRNELKKPVVAMAVAINGQPAYEEPITIYNRDLEDYAALLKASNYGLDIKVSTPGSSNPVQVIKTAFWEWDDHINGYELATRDRHILMTQKR